MKRIVLIIIFISTFLSGQSSAEKYIQRFAKTAVSEMEKYRIPASITLAQGMLESSYGKSDLANKSNNHFGIKCHSSWKGAKVYHDDDAKGECFRKYESAWFSFRDHSKFLQKSRYQGLYKYNKDYKKWAKGLKKAGYATNPKYPELLISKIKKYELWRYDNMSNNNFDRELDNALASTFKGNNSSSSSIDQISTPDVSKPIISPIIEKPKDPTPIKNHKKHTVFKHKTGRLPYVIARDGDTWDDISLEFDIKLKKLVKYNDVVLDRAIVPGQNIFLKKKKSRAKDKYHVVKPGDNMYLISQKYGVNLGDLYEKNLIRIGEQPKSGDVIYVKKKKRRNDV